MKILDFSLLPHRTNYLLESIPEMIFSEAYFALSMLSFQVDNIDYIHFRNCPRCLGKMPSPAKQMIEKNGRVW